MERAELTALLLLVVVAAVVAAAHVALTAIGKPAMSVPFSNETQDGTLVSLEGTIDRISHTREGGHLLLSVSDVQIFVPATAAQGVAIELGDPVVVYGTVQTYRGAKEIVVQAAEDIQIRS